MVGKPYAGKLHIRFDEGGQDFGLGTTLNGHEAGNGGYSQGLSLKKVEPVLYSTPNYVPDFNQKVEFHERNDGEKKKKPNKHATSVYFPFFLQLTATPARLCGWMLVSNSGRLFIY